MPENAGFLLVIAGVSVIMDVRSTCVDNGWILLSLGVGFFLRMTQEGLSGAAEFAAGIFLPAGVLGILFCLHMIGAGDIKLLCALGGIMGVRNIFCCILVSFLIGAVISLAILIACKGFYLRLHYLFSYFHEYVQTGSFGPYLKKGMTFENFHFTVPVFLSVMLYAGGVY